MKSNFSQHQQYIQGKVQNINNQQRRSKSNKKQGGSLEPRQGSHILDQNKPGANIALNDQMTIEKMIQINNQYYYSNMNTQQRGVPIQVNQTNMFGQINGQSNTNFNNSREDQINISSKISQGQIGNHQVSLDASKQIKQGQIQEVSGLKKNLLNAGIGSQSINRRKHSSVQRNHMTEKQTYLMEKFVQTPIITLHGDNNQNQFLTQTQNVAVKSNIEGGGSGGSGSQNNHRNLIQQANILPQNGFSNKDTNKQNFVQIGTQNHAKIINSKKQIHQQIVVNAGINPNQILYQQNMSNLKNRPPQDFIQMQLNKNQISRQEIHQNNTNHVSITAKADPNNQFQNGSKQLNSVSSNEIQQKQQLTYNQSPLIQQQQYNNTGNMQGVKKINALNNYLINQQSDFNINQQGFNQNFIPKNSNVKNGQSTILQTMISQNNSLTGGHQKNKMSAIVNGNQEVMTLHTKNSSYQIQKQPGSEMKFKQDQTLFLDQSVAQNQQKVVPRNSNQNTQTQIVQNLKSSGQRQSSKLRKNVSNVRNPVVQNATQQNGQRVSQQRRFNNTTLDNYQQQINQYNQNFNLNSVQPAETIQYDAQNIQTIQIQQALGTLQRGNQSRSVLRQNQQLKQFRNNYIPSNNYTQNAGSINVMATIQNQDINQKENGNQMRIKNQQIINRNEISNRAHNNSQFVGTVQQVKQPQASRANHSLKQQEHIPEPQSESEQSNTIHRQYLVEGPIDGRLSSLDQDSAQINQGSAVKGLHLRRNQPHNFSNISEKSSLMGDYGGTHTTHNNNQITAQGRQAGSNSAVNSANSQMPTVLNSNIIDEQQKTQNQFFAHRNTNIHQTVQQNQGNMIIKQGSKILGKSMNKSRGQLVRGATPQQQIDLLSENLIINNKNLKNNDFQPRRGSLPEGITTEPDQRSYLQQFQTMDQNNQQSKVINRKTPEQQKQNFVENNQQNKNSIQNKYQTIQGKAIVQNNQNVKQQSNQIADNHINQQNENKKSESQTIRNKSNLQTQNPQSQILLQNQENLQRKIDKSKQKQTNQEKNEFGFVIDPTIIKCVIEDTIEINQNPDNHIKQKNKIIQLPISKKESQQRKQIKLIQIKKNNGTNRENEENDNTAVNIFTEEQTNNLGFCEDDLMEEGEDIITTNNEDAGEEGFEIIESIQQTVSQKYDNIERSESQQLSLAVSGNLGQKIISPPVIIVPSPNVQEPNQNQPTKNNKLIQQNNVVMNKNYQQKEIGTKDQIVIKNNNIFLNADDVNELDSNMEPIAQLLPSSNNAKKNQSRIEPFPKLNNQKIVIQDDSIADKQMTKENLNKNLDQQQEQKKEEEQKKVINYETFESSSEDEFSCGAFESAAASFQNKEKGADQNLVEIQEQKRLEKQRRKERKALEKKKVRAEQDRQERKNLRKKYRLQSVGIEQYDEYQDDVLNFKDSQRDSVLSYFEGDIGLGIEITDIIKNKSKGQKKNQYNDDFFFKKHLIDTPTRLINFSNEFLPKKKKINPDKLKQKKNLVAGKLQHILNFKDLEMLSNIEKSQKSTPRKAEDEKIDNLINIFGQSEIEKLKNDIKSQLDKKADEKQYQLHSQSKSQGNKMVQNQNQKQTIVNNFQVNQQVKQLQEFKYKIKSNANKK